MISLKSLNKLLSPISKILDDNFTISKYSVLALAIIGSVGHPLYWLWWTYIDPQPEIPVFRIIGTITCFLLFSQKFWKKPFDKLFPLYWFFVVTFNFPFFFTTYLIKTDFSLIWSMAEVGSIFFVTMLFRNVILLISSLLFGVCFAIIYSSPIPINSSFNQDLVLFVYFPVFFFGIFSGIVTNYSGILSIIKNEREKYLIDKANSLKSLAGTIAHEIRNSLNSINLTQNRVKELLSDSNSDQKEIKKELNELSLTIDNSIEQANKTINIILADLSEKPIDPADFVYLPADKILLEIINKFGYKEESERQKVKLAIDEKNNFILKIVPERFTFVIYNLIKNGLYYLKDYPDSIITVGAENRVIDRVEYNVIYVHDTGPGIHPEIIPKLFEDFFTSGKKEGTGLGLSFCKRNMRILNGDIIVESEFGTDGKLGWTKFFLLFPKILNEKMELAKTESKKKKILIVDDQETILKTNKRIIEKDLKNVICDIARDGKEALEIFKEKNKESQNSEYYDIILTDIEMPIMNGMDFSKEIRKINKQIPIISYTSVLTDEIRENARKAGIDDFLTKPIPHNYLIKTLCKWTLTQYSNNDLVEKEILKGKRLLLADDEMVNRTLLAKSLKSLGLEVESISDGDELLAKYQENIKDDSAKKYDIILTDINMQKLNGDLATIKIREFESKNNIENTIPIIAYSGDGDIKDIYKFLRAGMDDYFIKGNDIKNLIDNIVFWIIDRDKELEQKFCLMQGIGSFEESQQDQYQEIDQEKTKKEITKIINQDFFTEIKNQIENLNSYPIINNRLDEETLNEVKDIFIKDLSRILVLIKKSFEDQNIHDFYFQTHALKGISGNVGAERLFVYTTYINNCSKKSEFPKEDNWLELLQNVINESKRFLEFKKLKKISLDV